MSLSRFDGLIARYTPDVVVAALGPFVGTARREAIERVLAARLAGIELVVEDIFDPRNAAAAMRTAEAFGLYRLHVADPNEEFRPAKTVTKGCHRWLTVSHHATTVAGIQALQARGVAVWAAALGTSHTLADIDVTRPVAVVFGNEHRGVSPAAQAACTGTFGVPMYGFSQSLNIAAAAAIVLHALTERRRAAVGALTDLAPAEAQAMRASMLAWSARQPEALVAHYAAGASAQGASPMPPPMGALPTRRPNGTT